MIYFLTFDDVLAQLDENEIELHAVICPDHIHAGFIGFWVDDVYFSVSFTPDGDMLGYETETRRDYEEGRNEYDPLNYLDILVD